MPEQVYRRKKLHTRSQYDGYYYGNDCDVRVDDAGKEYVSYYKMPAKKWLRTVNNGKVRRFKGDISNGASYRKLSEFWWEIY